MVGCVCGVASSGQERAWAAARNPQWAAGRQGVIRIRQCRHGMFVRMFACRWRLPIKKVAESGKVSNAKQPNLMSPATAMAA